MHSYIGRPKTVGNAFPYSVSPLYVGMHSQTLGYDDAFPYTGVPQFLENAFHVGFSVVECSEVKCSGVGWSAV